MRGSVKRTPAGSWRIVVEGRPDPATGRRRQIVRTVRGTKKAAEVELRRLIADQGGRVVPSTVTVADLVGRWFEATRPGLSPKTVEDRTGIYRRLIAPSTGHLRLSDLTAYHLDTLYAELRAKGYEEASILKVHGLLRGALAQAVRWEWLASNPADRARPPKQPKSKVVIPDVEVVRKLLAAADEMSPDFGVLVRLGAVTGLRRGELCALRWSDVELDAGVVSVSRSIVAVRGRLVEKVTKTDKARRLSVGADTAAMLRGHQTRTRGRLLELGVALAPDAFLFPHRFHGDQPTHPSSVSHLWLKVRRAAGVGAEVRLHDLRHHTASQLVAAGTDLRTVMERHGWTSLATAQRYVHAVEAKDRAAGEVLEKLLSER